MEGMRKGCPPPPFEMSEEKKAEFHKKMEEKKAEMDKMEQEQKSRQ
jgi:hypothetical protein